MKTTLQKVLALILCLSLCLGLIPPAWADEGKNEPSAGVSADDITFAGNSCIGTLAARMLEQEQSLAPMPGSVSDIVVYGTTATVDLSTDRMAKLVVAVYAEEGIKMLGSGVADVNSGAKSVTVEIDIDEMPTYFVTGAYLLDADTMEPISQEYISRYYTKEFQDFLASTTSDYDEKLVLNLDENTATNFLVYSDDTVRVIEKNGINQLKNNGDGSYTIYNADASVRGLSVGDKFSHTALDGTITVLLVGKISVKGKTVTITENKDATLEDIFDYYKLEENSETAEPYFDSDGMDEGVTYVDEEAALLQSFDPSGDQLFIDNTESFLAAPDENSTITYDSEANTAHFNAALKGPVDETWGHSFSFKFTYPKKSDDNDKPVEGEFFSGVKGSLTFGVSVNYKAYKSENWSYQSIKMDISAKIKGSVNVGYTARIGLGKPSFLMGPTGLKVSFPLKAVFESEGTVEVSGTIKGSIGFSIDSDYGLTNLSSTPSFDMDTEIEAKVFVGIEFEAEFSTVLESLATSFDVKVGFEIEGKVKSWLTPNASSSIKHNCKTCVAGTITLRCTISLKMGALWKVFSRSWQLADFKWKIADFYWSVDNQEFGWGTCPYISYLTKIHVLAANASASGGIPMVGTRVIIKNLDSGKPVIPENTYPTTDKNGIAETFLPSGEYKLSTNTGNGYRGEANISVKDFARDVNLWVQAIPAASGVWDNLNWAMDKNGRLTISGNGPMQDFEDNATDAWLAYKDDITAVNISEGVTSVGDLAFSGCCNLKKLSIPSSVTKVGWYAFSDCPFKTAGPVGSGCDFEYGWKTTIPMDTFRNCSSLEKISFPSTITEIGELAFVGCTGLTSIKIPEKVTTIGYYTFSGCKNLKKVTFPNGFKCVGNGAFHECSSLLDVVLPDGVTEIVGAGFQNCTSLRNIQIPKSVKIIGEIAFANCISLTKINIPEGVTTIYSAAFKGCRNLEKVTLPKSLTIIGQTVFGIGIFQYCSKLTSAGPIGSGCSIEYGWTDTFPESAFAECSNLTTIIIPDTVVSIDKYAFGLCTNLKDVYYGGTKAKWSRISVSDDGNEALSSAIIHYNSSGSSSNGTLLAPQMESGDTDALSSEESNMLLRQNTGGVIFAEKAAKLAPSEMNDREGKRAVFNNLVPGASYVLLIVEDSENDALLEPSNVLYISQLSADENGQISMAYVPRIDSNQKTALAFGQSTDNLKDAAVSLEQRKDGILQVHVSFGALELINETDYTYSIETKEKTIAVTMKGCGDYAGTVTFEADKIPHTPGKAVRENEVAATPKTAASYENVVYCTKCGAELSRKVVTVESTAVSGTWGNLTWKLDDNGLLTISGKGAMADLDPNAADAWLANKDSITGVEIKSGVTSIGGSAFYRCSALESVTIPAGVTSIGHGAFGRCTALTSVTIPAGVTSIGHDAFFYCKALTDIVLPDSVKKIDYCAFQDCSSLTELKLPSSLTAISKQLFLHCSSLKALMIPEGVTSIGRSAFSGCSSLADIYYGGTQQQWSAITSGAGNNDLHGAIVYCRDGIAFSLIPPSSLTVIEAEAFSGSAFTSVKLSEGTTTIGSRAFADCPKLRYIYIPEATTGIAGNAFSGVSNLTILGASGSYAEFYAQRYGYSFTAVE